MNPNQNDASDEMRELALATEALRIACDVMRERFDALCAAADAVLDAEFAKRERA